MSHAVSELETKSRWLSIRLNDQPFAVNIELVRELLPLKDLNISRLPQMEFGGEGVVQIRNEVVGVVDVRKILGMPSMREETDEIIQMFEERERDHVNWINELEASVRDKRKFSLQVDPNLCAFGKWYNHLTCDHQRLNEFTNGDLALTKTIEWFNLPHQRIHGIAKHVTKLVAKNQTIEAQEVINQTRETDLKAMIELFANCRKIFRELRQGVLLIQEFQGQLLGTMVDSVDEVITIEEKNIEQVSGLGEDHKYLLGIAKNHETKQLIQLLNSAVFFEEAR